MVWLHGVINRTPPCVSYHATPKLFPVRILTGNGFSVIHSIQDNGTKLQMYWTIVERMPALYKANLRSVVTYG